MTSPLLVTLFVLAFSSAGQPPVTTAVPVTPPSIEAANAAMRGSAKTKSVSARTVKLKTSKASPEASPTSAASTSARTNAPSKVPGLPAVPTQKKAARN